MKVELETQVLEFVRLLAPEPKKAVRRGLQRLGRGEGDIRALEGELENYYRLRILRYRIIFRYVVAGRKRVIRCVYAAPRNIIYEVFVQNVRDILR